MQPGMQPHPLTYRFKIKPSKMRNFIVIGAFLFAMPFAGYSQASETREVHRITLVPVNRTPIAKPVEPVESAQPLTKEEKIERLELKIESVESKIEVLTTEDPEGNAAEIQEKKNLVAEMKEELRLLKSE